MTKFLVTGAAGFIARKVIQQLVSSGHEVVGIDNLNDSYDVRLKEWRLKQLATLVNFHFIKEDICSPTIFNQISINHPEIQAVIHLAARAGVRQATEIPEEYLRTNTTGTLNILEWCRKTGINKLVLASTSSIYGANPPLPTTEEADSSHPLQIYAAFLLAA
jgi:UDP-glucuronate 4-epimerase